MAVAVPHQDVLIIADIRNDTGYDILAQITMGFSRAEMFQLRHYRLYMKMGSLNRFLLWGKTVPR